MAHQPYPSRRPAVAQRNPLLEYMPDLLVATTFFFISMSKSAYSIGALAPMIWLGCGALLMITHRGQLGSTVFRWWPLLLTPLMAFLSFIWSDLPEVSSRYGLQLLLTAFLGVFFARILSPQRFVVAIFLGMFVFCVLSVLSNRVGPAAEGWVMIGLTGSKNALAFAAQLEVAAALAVFFIPTMARPLRLLAIVGIGIGVYIIASAHSASAIVLAIVSSLMFITLYVMQRFSPAGRVATLLVVVMIFAPLALAMDEITNYINDFMINVLHKDPTLTGRTYLWARADDLIERKPWLGYGFQAMWLSESTETLAILRENGQTDGRVFNFHHTYRQIAVDIGLVGAGIFAVTVAMSLFAGARQFVLFPTGATSFAFIVLLVSVIKSFTELIIVSFSPPTIIFFAVSTYAFAAPSKEQRANFARSAHASPNAPPMAKPRGAFNVRRPAPAQGSPRNY